MNHRVAYLLIAGCAFAGPETLGAGAPPRPVSPNVEILIEGVAQPRYAHAGRWYVEARKGREYAIRVHNPYGVRVAVALSVDGLNTIDARDTTAADARKWVLDPYETVTISGWQTSQTHARRFEFTTEEKSYGQALGKTANLGVISAVFFKERVARETRRVFRGRTAQEAPQAPAPSEKEAQSAALGDVAGRSEEYAATGMGRRTDHAVTQVWLDLEPTPAQTVNIRYEYRPQLVRLGIMPSVDPLQRREQALGFAPER